MPARKPVIVLDDDISIVKALGRLLTAHGFESELFGSVHDFQSRARLDRAERLVLDINLDGASGIEIRRQLALTYPAIPVVFITAQDSEATRTAAMAAGCSAYLAKPFSAKSLIDAIEKASAASAGAAQDEDQVRQRLIKEARGLSRR